MVTENGTCVDKDEDYYDFLCAHLRSVFRALQEGIDVIGYVWWTLIDNFEWDNGYKARFGLVEVDFRSFERKVRPFAGKFAAIIEKGQL